MKRNIIIGAFSALFVLGAQMLFTSCSDMMDVDSDIVEFDEDNKINAPEDSVYSVMGIIHSIQKIATRNVLLGDVRGDLVSATSTASVDLQAIANFTATTDNAYNTVSDYYAVINNCNSYLAKADTMISKRNVKLFKQEYVVVKAFRAWTYLQAAQIYGRLPLVLEPITTESKAEEEQNKQRSDITAICEYFINDLQPYVNEYKPNYGSVGGYDSRRFFLPLRALLGDLCLWAGRYREAAQYYHDYITDRDDYKVLSNRNVAWSSSTADFESIYDSYSNLTVSKEELLSLIPMETLPYYGVTNDLYYLCNSEEQNYCYYSLTPSAAIRSLSEAQIYCMEYKVSDTKRDTIYAPRENLLFRNAVGDLRFFSYYNSNTVNRDEFSKYSSDLQEIRKGEKSAITTYRLGIIYLRYAEALNRAGYPQAAFAVLKYGLCSENINNYVDEEEREGAGSLLTFDTNIFTKENAFGIHSRGSGDSQANAYYVLPQPTTELASRADTVAYQIPLVEDIILNEMALEGVFEGYRFNDLMRVALRRADPSYLAKPVAMRNGEQNTELYSKLLDTNNWYLPLK